MVRFHCAVTHHRPVKQGVDKSPNARTEAASEHARIIVIPGLVSLDELT